LGLPPREALSHADAIPAARATPAAPNAAVPPTCQCASLCVCPPSPAARENLIKVFIKFKDAYKRFVTIRNKYMTRWIFHENDWLADYTSSWKNFIRQQDFLV
jgi:hypothetical protein